jgi:hypothetical protein
MNTKAISCLLLTMALVAFPMPVWAQANFLRGDTNHDQEIDISDAVFTLAYLFLRTEVPRCLDAADFDDNGEIDIVDAVGLLPYLFTAGIPPAAPFPVFDADPTPDELSCLPEVPGAVSDGGSELSGDITEDITLTNDKTYRLVGGVFVKDGATLTIDPGVTILCDSTDEAYLAIERGAKIFAVGTRTHPVVFTSDRPVGQRSRADWGGLLVCGRAPANVDNGEWIVKDFSDLWAGGGSNPDPQDSSGRMSYVRIEYSGATVPGAPLSAISFCAVGSGTQLDHIQAKYGDDDGLEWYGGTCSLKYGISVGMGDEGIDCEYGWQGRAQFIVCLQDPEAGNEGFLDSEDSGKPFAEPRTHPTLSNLALVGAWSQGSRSGYGLRIRRYAGLNLYNTIIQSWRDGGVDFGSDFGPVTIDRCALYDNDDDCTGNSSMCTALFAPPLQNLVSQQPVMVDPSRLDDPNFRGIPAELPTPLDPATVDDWFDSTDYVGPVPPEGQGDDWTHEPWISWHKD